MPSQAFLDPQGRLVVGYRPRRQAVVAEDSQPLRKHVSLGAVCLLANPRVALQKAVQVFLATIEAVELVLAPQLLDRSRSRSLGDAWRREQPF